MKLSLSRDRQPSGRGCSERTRRPSQLLPFHSAPAQRGVALVITLIMLSVITFMAVAFLVLTRGERSSVGTVTDQAVARLGADAAAEQAKIQLIAPMMAVGTPYNFDLLVSTNFVSAPGFLSGNNNVTNANYLYPNGTPLNANDSLQNLGNLLFSPRPPVFVDVPAGPNITTQDFRYYLDLNRNGRYDTNGPVAEIGWDGLPILNPISGLPITNFYVGDPEWVGGLEFPDRRHSRTNRFLYRYAYIVVPSGKTLDINYIHNSAKQVSGARPYDFFRNQGVGSWEINLAAFLRDLNTNIWWGDANMSYGYRTADPVPIANTGTAFEDAFAVLRYRNRDFPNPNKSVLNLFGAFGADAFRNDGIDGYSAAPVPMLATTSFAIDPDINTVNTHWYGAESVNHFFTTQDLFDPAKTSLPFVTRIRSAGATNSTYDRYTYYRMLSQLGTDTTPDPDTRVNLNYDNKVFANNAGVVSATNFIPWQPTNFFIAAANGMLANAGYNFDVSRIQIYPTNYYTPSVHRLLQLAANIYDATTNRYPVPAGTNTLALPTAFRPEFFVTTTNGTQVWITGFQEIRNFNDINLPAIDLETATNNLSAGRINGLVNGFPVIFGAKKGWPNFNEFGMQTEVTMTRKLQFLKRNAEDTSPYLTNQMYTISVSNRFGLEAWNSYSNRVPVDVRLTAVVDTRAYLSNQLGQLLLIDRPVISTNVVLNSGTGPGGIGVWPGYISPALAQYSFKVPLHPSTNSFYFLTNRPYSTQARQFTTQLINWEQGFDVPHLWLVLKTHVRYILTTDENIPRLIDYVNLAKTEEPLYITGLMMRDAKADLNYLPDGSIAGMFNTNRGAGLTDIRTPTFGVRNQIGVSAATITTDVVWNPAPSEVPRGLSRDGAINFFRLNIANLPARTQTGERIYKTNLFFAPYVPSRTLYFFSSWQANDPLVHYTIGDLMNLENTNRIDFTAKYSSIANIGGINERYEPWGGNPEGKSSSPTKYQLAVKDPLVRRSDDWDFPTNKFPNIGWLGRVHRGTPWQTVYLKASEIDPKQMQLWMKWTGNFQAITNWDGKGRWKFDADFSLPHRDRELVDVFTTALTENGSKGRLSINQSGLAAWSAVLSGVVSITNTLADADVLGNPFLIPSYAAALVEPAGVYDPVAPTAVARIVEGINTVRTTSTNKFPNKTFMRLGDILSVPELTVGTNPYFTNGAWVGASPFLNLGNPNTADRATRLTQQQIYALNDAAYERIPQQVLGLLHCDAPRFVIYSFGQSLKPAPDSVVSAAGGFFGMVTNYQVTAESATRTVVRVENAPANPRVVVESFNVLPPD